MNPRLENWSRDYWLACEVTVNTHDGDYALMDADLYDDLVYAIGEPIVGKVGGLTYEFMPSMQVLADRAAVPSSNHSANDSLTLLLSK